MKKRSIGVSFCLLFFTFAGCGTSSVFPVPGERKAVLSNISAEYFSIAETYKKLGNYAKAVSYYEKVLDSETLGSSALYEIAVCNMHLKEWDKARQSLEILLLRDPQNASLRLSLAYIEAQRGNLEAAENLYRSLSLENPDDAMPLKNLIIVLLSQKKYEEAKESFSLLKEIFPDEESVPLIQAEIDGLLQ